MSAQEFKSSPARLVRLFRKSRDVWKQRAANKQHTLKKIRITVRDLSASRDHWRRTMKGATNSFPLLPKVIGGSLAERRLLPGMTGTIRLQRNLDLL